MLQEDNLDMIVDQEPGDPKPIKGGVSTTRNTTPAWETNTNYIKKQVDKYNQDALSFATQAFTIGETLPTVNGKQLGSIDELTKYMNDPDANQSILEQAGKIIIDKPDLDSELAASLLEKRLDLDEIIGSISLSNQLIGKDLQNAAITVDAKLKAQGKSSSFASHNSMISPDGSFIDADEWSLGYVNQQIEKTNAAAMRDKMSAGPTQRDIENADLLRLIKGGKKLNYASQSGPTMINFKPKMQSENQIISQSLNRMMPLLEPVTADNLKGSPFYEQAIKQYTDSNKRIIEEYNKNSKTKKVQAERQGIYTNNAGGATMAASSYNVRFDTDNAFTKDEQGNKQISNQMGEVVDFVSKLRDTEGLLFSKGAPSTENGREVDADAAKLFRRLYDDIRNTLYDKSRKPNDKGRPFGEITMQPIGLGDEQYHAYHVKMRPEYFKKYMGTKTEPGYARTGETNDEGELIDAAVSGKIPEEGYTVYVPVESSKKTNIGARSLKGTSISYVEGNIALSPKGEYTMNIPGGANVTIKRNTNQGYYMVSGNALNYNPNTARYDTIPLNALNIKSQYGLDVDLDGLAKYIRKQSISLFKKNHTDLNSDKRLRGVRDPKQLSQ
jgi:hypothetical protein